MIIEMRLAKDMVPLCTAPAMALSYLKVFTKAMAMSAVGFRSVFGEAVISRVNGGPDIMGEGADGLKFIGSVELFTTMAMSFQIYAPPVPSPPRRASCRATPSTLIVKLGVPTATVGNPSNASVGPRRWPGSRKDNYWRCRRIGGV